MKIYVTVGKRVYQFTDMLNPRKMSIRLRAIQQKSVKFEGTIKVSYSSIYSNEFDFDSLEDAKTKLMPCLDPELIEDFKRVKK